MKNIEPKSPPTKEEQFNNEMMNWLYDSHYWGDLIYDNRKCAWCGRMAGNVLTINFPICKENPAIKKLSPPKENK